MRLLGHLRDDKNVRKAIRAQKPVSILDPKTAFSKVPSKYFFIVAVTDKDNIISTLARPKSASNM